MCFDVNQFCTTWNKINERHSKLTIIHKSTRTDTQLSFLHRQWRNHPRIFYYLRHVVLDKCIRSKEAEEIPNKTKATPPLPRRAKNVTNPHTSLLHSEFTQIGYFLSCFFDHHSKAHGM